MTAFVGNPSEMQEGSRAIKERLFRYISQLYGWLEENDYRSYDPFDGLQAKFLRPLTLNNRYLLTVLQQGVRRFPINLRPLLGISKSHSSKAMGFLARGFIRLHDATGNSVYADKARFALQWLTENQARGYSGACWGNHFDYQSRSGHIARGVPTVVWTSLIGHAFLDAYEYFQDPRYLRVAISSCEHVLRDLTPLVMGDSVCISYVPTYQHQVHNGNTLGASLLARGYYHTGNHSYTALAEKAITYTAQHQRPDGSWYYGEAPNLRWIDNFHTAYVLDSFKHYIDSTGDDRFGNTLMRGYEYWKNTFFLEDGTPRYYHHKTLPIDIQCCSQAIDTLVFFRGHDAESLHLARKIAEWTIAHMQDRTGYFYYRRYSRWLVNKTPTLHWGEATMLCALAGLYQLL
jgi:uncharacterized protein YyaL (SSP411 family)